MRTTARSRSSHHVGNAISIGIDRRDLHTTRKTDWIREKAADWRGQLGTGRSIKHPYVRAATCARPSDHIQVASVEVAGANEYSSSKAAGVREEAADG
jgi:hypothetical protein